MKILLGIVFSALLFLPLTGSASLFVGTPVEGNSWNQLWTTENPTSIQTIEAFIISGNGVFENPGMNGFTGTASGWVGTVINPTYTYGSGLPTANSTFLFNTHFAGNIPTSNFTIDFLAWDIPIADVLSTNGTASNVVEYTRLSFNNGWVTVWNFPTSDLTLPSGFNPYAAIYNRSAVPIPAAAYLLSTGLLGLVIIRRRNKML